MKKQKKIQIITAAVIITAAYIIWCRSKGATAAGMLNLPKAIENNVLSWNNERITYDELQTGDVVVMFKWGCRDCHAIHDAMLGWDEANKLGAHYVSAETKNGTEMASEFSIREVPSVVLVMRNGTYMTEKAYKTDDNGNTVIDNDALDKIIEKRKNL